MIKAYRSDGFDKIDFVFTNHAADESCSGLKQGKSEAVKKADKQIQEYFSDGNITENSLIYSYM